MERKLKEPLRRAVKLLMERAIADRQAGQKLAAAIVRRNFEDLRAEIKFGRRMVVGA